MFAGQVDTPNECYVMHWPGLVALFPIAAQHAASWQNMQQGGALPLALPNGSAPVASRLCIHAGNAGESPSVLLLFVYKDDENSLIVSS